MEPSVSALILRNADSALYNSIFMLRFPMNATMIALALWAGLESAARRTDGFLFQGEWNIKSAFEDGKEAPSRREMMVRVVFQGNRIVVRDGRDETAAECRLDPTRNPRRLEMIPLAGPFKGQSLNGVYQLNGDTLQIALPLNPTIDPPTDFQPRPGGKMVILTLQREVVNLPLRPR